jgi:fatty acid desaturase
MTNKQDDNVSFNDDNIRNIIKRSIDDGALNWMQISKILCSQTGMTMKKSFEHILSYRVNILQEDMAATKRIASLHVGLVVITSIALIITVIKHYTLLSLIISCLLVIYVLYCRHVAFISIAKKNRKD